MDPVAIVAGLFADAFNRESVGPDDDFFRMGGDSLVATDIVVGVELTFRVAVSISALLTAPTPRLLAGVVAKLTAAGNNEPLIVVRYEGSGPPLCCVHGMNGESVFPWKIAEEVSGRPVYAFRALGLEKGERPPESVAQIASAYLAGLRRVRPKGPYVFAGHCGGSMIAYEMACQCVAAGDPVSGLTMIDPSARYPFLFNKGARLALAQAQFKDEAARLQTMYAAGAERTEGWRRKLVRRSLFVAMGTYSPGPFAGEALLLHTTARKAGVLNPKGGFPTFMSRLEVREIKSKHENMFKENMADVVGAIRAFLDRVAPVPPQ